MCLLATVNLDFRFVCLTLKKTHKILARVAFSEKVFCAILPVPSYNMNLGNLHFHLYMVLSHRSFVSSLLPKTSLPASPVFTLLPWCYEVVCV